MLVRMRNRVRDGLQHFRVPEIKIHHAYRHQHSYHYHPSRQDCVLRDLFLACGYVLPYWTTFASTSNVFEESMESRSGTCPGGPVLPTEREQCR
jgi:hypothetical protein